MSGVCRTLGRLTFVALLCAGCGRSNLAVPREQVGAGLRDAAVGEGSMLPQAGSVAPPPPGGPPPGMDAGVDAGARDGGVRDAGLVDAGRRRDAGADAAVDAGAVDAGEIGPPVIELLAPGRDVEVYQGDRVTFLAKCKAVGAATISERSWLFAVDDDDRSVVGDSAQQTFARNGTYDVRYQCFDSRSQLSTEHVTVHVRSAQPFLVYRDPDHVQAARVDHLDQPVLIEPTLAQTAPLIDDDFQYARGGKAVIVTASSERHVYVTYAVYLDAPVGMQLHELDRYSDQETRSTPNILISPDGNYVFVAHMNRVPRVYRLDPAAPTWMTAIAFLPSLTLDQSGTQFSSDSRYLLYSAGGELALIDLQNGATHTLWSYPAGSGSSLRYARFSGDGTQVVYSISQSDGNSSTYLVAAAAALAGGDPKIQLGAAQASSGFWPGDSGAVLVTGVAANGAIETITAYDRTGSAIASYDGSEWVSVCGDSLLLLKSDGSLAVVHPGATTESLIGLDPPSRRVSFSSDCHALAYESGNDVLFFALPALGSPPGTPAVDRIVQQRLGRFVPGGAGPVLATAQDDPQPAFLQLNRLGQPATLIARSDFAFTPDGLGVLSFRSSTSGFPSETFLDLGTFATNSTAFSSATLYGPFQVAPNQRVLISPDGKHALIHPQQSVSADGTPVALRGLVEVDLVDPSGPGTHAILPDGDPDRGSYTLVRVPEQRAVLLGMPGDVPGTSRYYVRALADGASTIEQDHAGPPNTFDRDLLVSGTTDVLGRHGYFALHSSLHGDDELALIPIRIGTNDWSGPSSIPSDPSERLVGFGLTPNDLVLSHGALDDSPGADRIEQYDFNRGERTLIAQSSGNEGLQLERVVTGSSRIFYERFQYGVGTSTLFVKDSLNGPKMLTPLDRKVEAFDIAPEGDRLSVQLSTSTSNPDVWVLDEGRAWESWSVPTIQSATASVTFFSNAQREGMVISPVERGQGHILRIAPRDDPGGGSEIYIAGLTRWFVSADNTRVVIVASSSGGTGDIYTLDLTVEQPELEDRGPLTSPLLVAPDVLASSPDGRFLVLGFGDDKQLFDVVTGQAVLYLLPNSQDFAFDRLGRYLAYDLDGTSCDIAVVALDPLDDSRWISRWCPAQAPLWVD